MNWKRLYATIEIGFTVGLGALFVAVSTSIIITVLCNKIFAVSGNQAMIFVAMPTFLFFLILFLIKLPETFRKQGILSDRPDEFGPWFKDPDK